MNYKIYYHLESAREYLDVHNAEEQSDLSGLEQLLEKAVGDEDVISIYLPESRNRIEIISNGSSWLILELHDSNVAGIYSKQFLRNSIDDLLAAIPKLAENPESCEFSFANW